MKSLILPTNNNIESKTVRKFAQYFAQKLSAKVRSIHIFHPFLNDNNDIQKNTNHDKYSNEFSNQIQLNDNDTQIEFILGLPSDELIRLSTSQDVELIVVFLEQDGYNLDNSFHIKRLCEQSECPVLLIHEKIIFKKIEKILVVGDSDFSNYNEQSITVFQLLERLKTETHCIFVKEDDWILKNGEIAETTASNQELFVDGYSFHLRPCNGQILFKSIKKMIIEEEFDLVLIASENPFFFKRYLREEQSIIHKIPLMIYSNLMNC